LNLFPFGNFSHLNDFPCHQNVRSSFHHLNYALQPKTDLFEFGTELKIFCFQAKKLVYGFILDIHAPCLHQFKAEI